MTNQKIQLVIDGHDNKEKEIETGIPQGFLVLPIIFLIYISDIFKKVLETNPMVISLSFVDNLGFITLGSFVKEIVKTFEKVAQVVLEWEILNSVTYNMAKTKPVLFSKSHQQCLNKQLQEAKIKVGNNNIPLNNDVTR